MPSLLSILRISFYAVGLVVITVVIQAVGFDALLRALIRSRVLTTSGFGHAIRFVIGLACGLILIHLLEISVWGLFYFWRGCLPNFQDAVYFSGATYTTAGYGDLVLPKAWRMLAPLEALTGILMCGISAALFFAIVSRWISKALQTKIASEHP